MGGVRCSGRGPLKGFVTSGLASSKIKVSDYGATALANHIPPSGAFSLAMAALECSVAEAWWNLVLFHSCMPQTAGKLLGAGGGKDLPLEGNVQIFTTSQGLCQGRDDGDSLLSSCSLPTTDPGLW